MVKPKAKKEIEEYKSLRLKTAISANPVAVVHWDKLGVVLETGNKYSIYNDGDFYYLEVNEAILLLLTTFSISGLTEFESGPLHQRFN